LDPMSGSRERASTQGRSGQEPVGGTAIRVHDTAAALLSLGAFGRGRVGGAIGITGSVGKTTTEDLLAGCLASTFRTAASERSFNNELGLPLTLLNAPDAARWVVLEMGARGAGHIERLAEVARPDVGIVTRVAMAHVEYSVTSTAWPAPRARSWPRCRHRDSRS
jgi:UDP-N-acetylmuramoyl-tripeptide--D-alanyl-D-alanine ligase